MLLISAARDLYRHKNSSTLILAVAMTTALIISLISSTDFSASQLERAFTKATSPVDIIVSRGDGAPFNQSGVVASLEKVQGVELISPRIQVNETYRLHNGTRYSANLLGIAASDLELGNYPAVQAGRLQGSQSLLSQDLAFRLYNVGNYNATDIILTDWSNHDHLSTVAGTFYPQMFQLWIRNTIIVSLQEAQTLAGWSGLVNIVVLKLRDFLASARVDSQIIQTLGSSFTVTDMKAGISELVRSDQETFISALQIPLYFATFFAIAFFTATLFINIGQRKGEFSTMKILGATRWQLLKIFTYESLMIGLLGAAIGALLGNFLPAVGLLEPSGGPTSAQSGGSPPYNILTYALFVGLLSTVLGFLTQLLIQENKFHFHKVLKPIGRLRILAWILPIIVAITIVVHPYPISGWIVLFDVVTFVIAISVLMWKSINGAKGISRRLFGGFGGIAPLIPKNSGRNLGKHFATVSMLALAISFVILTTGVESSLSSAVVGIAGSYLGADVIAKPILSVTSNSTSAIRTIPGVETVTPVYVSQTTLDGNPIALVAIDPITFPKIVKLIFDTNSTNNPYQRLGNQPIGVLIARPLLNILNTASHQQLTINSSFELSIRSMNSNVTIESIFSAGFFHWLALNGVPLSMSIFLSSESFFKIPAPSSDNDQVSFFLIKTKAGANVDDVSQGIKRSSNSTLETFTANGVKAQAAIEFNYLLLGMQLVTILSVVEATLSIFVVETINVSERKFEFGLFKVLGMTRKQSIGLFSGESIVDGLLGLAAGILGGIVLLAEVISFTAHHLPITLVLLPYSLLLPILIALLLPFAGIIITSRRLSSAPAHEMLKAKPIRPLNSV